MTNTHNQIKNFITTLQNEYPQLKVDYEYDADEDYYYIKHNSSDLQFNNEEFPQFVGKLIRTYFYNNDIFNISFGYDYYFQKNRNANI